MGMLGGQYQNAVRVVGFNTAEGWSKDVSADVAHEVRYRFDPQMRDVPFYLEDFVERHEGRYHDVQLPLRHLRPRSHLANDGVKVFTPRGHDWTNRFKKIAVRILGVEL
jgi:hypothetical protein